MPCFAANLAPMGEIAPMFVNGGNLVRVGTVTIRHIAGSRNRPLTEKPVNCGVDAARQRRRGIGTTLR